MFEFLRLEILSADIYKEEAMKNSISSQLRFAALHDCETKWKQCGKPSNIKKLKGKIDRFGIPEDGS